MIETPLHLPIRRPAGTADCCRKCAGRAADGIGVLRAARSPHLSASKAERFEDAHAAGAHAHISIFHLVAHGRCTFETDSGNRREIGPGDLLLMPFADAHKFWAGNTTETA
jgi:mannose-6-phosphate isomerase-like protein (cupin superfamily)